MIARVAAVAALIGAVVLVVLILFGGGPSYTVTAEFQDAGGLVPGNLVLIGPAQVGSVRSIDLGSNGQAVVKFSVGSGAAPLHQGTVARCRASPTATSCLSPVPRVLRRSTAAGSSTRRTRTRS
jgi:ABC-type transporter Mla subunit MlaD